MKANKEAILYGIIGLLTGSLITLIIATASVNNHNNTMMQMMGMHTDGNNHSSSQDMNDMNMPRHEPWRYVMSDNMHLIIMGAGFISLLLLSYLIGTSALVLFFFLCFFMMSLMMLWGHGDGKGGGHEH